MRRRRVLKGGGGAFLGLLSAGCLDAFAQEDAWRELIINPPDGVYIPPKIDEMKTFGRRTTNGCIVAVMATRPHSFWTTTSSERSRADLRSSHTMHLMVSIWDGETTTVLPTPVTATIRQSNEFVEERSLWPMLTQRMGFHYGDNVSLDGDGTYTVEIQFGPVDTRSIGEFSDRFQTVDTVDITFEYSETKFDDLDRTLIDADEGRSKPGAIEPMERAGTPRSTEQSDRKNTETGRRNEREHDNRTVPPSVAPPVDLLPGEVVGTETSDDITFAITTIEDFRKTDGTYVAISPRTAYNRFTVPLMSLSGTVVRDGQTMFSGTLSETIDPELDHHYGTVVDSIEPGDELSLTVDTPPQLSLHEGYETAFRDPVPGVTTIGTD